MSNQIALKVPENLLEQCFAQGLSDYPNETCGVLSGPKAAAGKVDACHPLTNVLEELHELDPEHHPRSPTEGYLIDPREQLKLDRELRKSGRAMRIIYHSHPDVGAYFSQQDIDDALWDGRPRYPGIQYLVLGVKPNQRDGAILAVFNDETREFDTHPVC